MIPMPYCIVSEGGKDSSTKVDWPWTSLDKLAQLHKNDWEFNITGSIIFNLDSRGKESPPNKAGNALDDGGEDSKD